MSKPDERPDTRSIQAAATILYEEGQMHGWWSSSAKSFEDLDAIGKSEFEGIVERMLMAARHHGEKGDQKS